MIIDIILIFLGIICLIVGLAGCIIPMLPGPPIAYVGLILLHLTDQAQLSTTELLVCLLLMVVVQVLDYITPMLGTKYSGGGGKWANRGTLIGTVLGLFFLPWGIIVGPFAGSKPREILITKEQWEAMQSGQPTQMEFSDLDDIQTEE